MSSFLSYNTDDPNAAAMGQTPLGSGATITIGPVQSGVANKVAGSIFSDTAGTLWVYQSFDYNRSIDPTTGQPVVSAHWDVVQPAVAGQAIVASTPFTIDFDVLAPTLQLVFTNSASVNTHLRIFLRVFGQRNQA